MPSMELPGAGHDSLQMLYQPPWEPVPNSFDELLNDGLHISREDTGSTDSFSIFEQYLNDNPSERSEKPASCKLGLESLQPWRKGFWSFNRKSPSDLVVDKQRKTHSNPSHVSPTILHHHDGYSSNSSSHFVYSSPTKKERFNAQIAEHSGHDIRLTQRQQTLSPSPMCAQLATEGKTRQQELWQEQFQNSRIQSSASGVQSGGISFNKHSNKRGKELKQYNHNTMSLNEIPHVTQYAYPSQSTEHFLTDFEAFQNSSVDTITQDNHLRERDGIFESINIDYHASDRLYELHDLQALDTNSISYNPPLHSPPDLWETPSGFNEDIYHSIEPFDPSAFIQSTSSFANMAPPRELRAEYPSPEEIGCAVPYGPSKGMNNQLAFSMQTDHPASQYPILPSPVNIEHNWIEVSPSRKVRATSSPLSPTRSSGGEDASSRPGQHRSPSRDHNSRRKSISRAGPIRETTPGSASPRRPSSRSRSQTQSQSSTKARHRSVSAKANKAARSHNSTTASLAGFEFDFVNFTLKDSAKLMTDVAPSGSSKTKARREQEAKDKRKRNNEVALSAVRAAGGNVRELQMRLVS